MAANDDDVPELWERQPGETAKAFDQFCVYRDLGRGRTLARCAEILTKNASYIRRVASDRDWVRRAGAWDAELDRLTSLSLIDRRRAMAERHAQLAVAFLSKVAARLMSLKVDELTPSELARWLEVATKIERQSLGEPTEHVQHTGPAGGPIEHALMTDDERRARLAELTAEASRRLSGAA